MLSEKNKEALSSLFLGLLAILLTTFLIAQIRGCQNENIDKNKTKEQVNRIENKVEELKKNLTPYEYKDKLNKVNIVSNFKNTSKNNLPTESFTKKLNISGKFSEGYLYVKASVGSNPLTKNDDVYAKISGNVGGKYLEVGGHLISSKGLEVPSSEKYTNILFNLSDIKYKSSYLKNENEAISGDWLSVLNGGNANVVIGFLSTAGEGNLEELDIYYKCIEGTECSVVVQ